MCANLFWQLAWVLYCDIICLDYDGNLLDASVFALLAALKNGKSSLEQDILISVAWRKALVLNPG